MNAEQFAEQNCNCSSGNSAENRTPQTLAGIDFPAEQHSRTNLFCSPYLFLPFSREGTVEQAEQQ